MISSALDKGISIFPSVGSVENVLFFMLSIMFSGGQTVKSGISCTVILHMAFARLLVHSFQNQLFHV